MDICIVLGSKSDLPVSNKCSAVLEEFNIEHEVRVASAHRAPKYLEGVIDNAIADGCKIFIGMAGMAAALPYVDRFIEGHNMDSLTNLAALLSE